MQERSKARTIDINIKKEERNKERKKERKNDDRQ